MDNRCLYYYYVLINSDTSYFLKVRACIQLDKCTRVWIITMEHLQ